MEPGQIQIVIGWLFLILCIVFLAVANMPAFYILLLCTIVSCVWGCSLTRRRY